jgi:ATP adenylyltransferase
MEHLWSPWRREFIEGVKEEGCIFCRFVEESGDAADRKNLVLGRTERSFAVLNKYPYNNGHLMVVPRRHTADYAGLDGAEVADLHGLLQASLRIVEDAYRPAGANLGMNLGRDAGAGIDSHLHWHLVPRWRGDTNFMPVVGATKVMIELLDQTWDALRPRFDAALAG